MGAAAAERTKWKTAVCSEMGGQGCWVASRQTTIIDHDNFLARQTIGSPRSQELDLGLPARKLTLCADQECGAYNRGRRRRNPSRRLLGKELGDHFSRLRLFEEEGRKSGQTDARTNASSRKSWRRRSVGGRGHAVALTPSAELPSSVRVFAKSRMTRI